MALRSRLYIGGWEQDSRYKGDYYFARAFVMLSRHAKFSTIENEGKNFRKNNSKAYA